jgi:4,5-DOPA dioxygenase extradiol
VLFVGHGSPMNAISDNEWSRGFRALGDRLPRPRAILAVSAHWYLPDTLLTGEPTPRTIHDFWGFPRELHELRYPAPGEPALARRVAGLLGGDTVADWGLDHGTWSVLVHTHPAADVPVVQLSIDERLPAERHLAIGRALAPLRDEGVLVMASGNIVHNLRHALSSADRGLTAPPAWATDFDAAVAGALERHDLAFLAAALTGPQGSRAHPTPEHYLPLLYAAGAAGDAGPVRFPLTGFDLGSLSMRAVLFG